MKKINKDTIIEMRPDKDGVFKPIGKVVSIPSVKEYSYKVNTIRNRKTKISEFLEGFSIGVELINKFKKSVYR
ncbi:MAG: hypothetical protein DDT22_00253 [candidate division WS2 bacterium]|nr:hypothetical protein [Candidatus Lithacetigena glycinireducens]